MQTNNSSSLPALNWDNLKLALTIARNGSLNGAAAELGINVSTASRRLAQLESALATVCFVRRPAGIEPTPAGQVIIDHAREVEQQMVALRHAAACQSSSPSVTVTVTCTDLVGSALVIPALASLSTSAANVLINLNTDERLLDLHRGEADLAFRVKRPANGGLRIRKIAEIGYGLYASRDYLERVGRPATTTDLAKHQLVGNETIHEHHLGAMWWESHCARGRVIVRADRSIDRQECAQNGLGIALLANPVGRKAGLERVLPEENLPCLEVFLLAQPGALQVPHVRELAEHIATYARAQSRTLA